MKISGKSIHELRKIVKDNPQMEIKIEHDAFLKLLDEIEKLENILKERGDKRRQGQ